MAIFGTQQSPGLLGYWAQPGPIGLKGLLAQQFDPKELRYQTGANALTQLGLGLMNPDPQAPNPWLSGLSRGISGAAQGAQDAQDSFYKRGFDNVKLMGLQREQDQYDQQQAALAEFKKSPEYAALTPSMRSWIDAYPKEALQTWGDAKFKAQYPTGTDRYGVQPYIVKGEDGKLHAYQLDKQTGVPKEIITNGEFQPKLNYLDIGTGYQPMTTQGANQGGPVIPKDVAGAEAEKQRGKVIADYRSMKSKMPGLETVVSELDDLSNKATYTAAGQVIDLAMRQAGMEPRESAVARARYISMVNNQILPLLRDTFGAQFTEREGETLRATLGDPNKTPAEKQAVLKSFIEQKRRDVEALAVQSGQASPPESGGSTGTRLRYNPDTGELE